MCFCNYQERKLVRFCISIQPSQNLIRSAISYRPKFIPEYICFADLLTMKWMISAKYCPAHMVNMACGDMGA
jgi:hypothetical protein